MWGKSGFHDPAKPGKELSWDMYPQRQDCFIMKTDMKIKANSIALELSVHFLIICNMSAITQVVKYLSSCLHCATQHYRLKSPAVKKFSWKYTDSFWCMKTGHIFPNSTQQYCWIIISNLRIYNIKWTTTYLKMALNVDMVMHICEQKQLENLKGFLLQYI